MNLFSSLALTQDATPRLWGLHYSPFTEKARWALDHHELPYAYIEHVPLLGEAALRARGSRSVPLMIDAAGPHEGAAAIARRAESVGRGPALFDDPAAVTKWETTTELGLTAARALVVQATLEDTRAQEESLAGLVPRRLIPHAQGLSRIGTRFLARKYGLGDAPGAGALSRLTGCAEKLMQAIDANDGPYLVGSRFSYADICGAALVQCISPPLYLPLAPATRECWVQRPLVTRFGGLLEWRDTLVDRHRKSRAYAT